MGPNASLDMADMPCDSGYCVRSDLERAIFDREQKISTLEIRCSELQFTLRRILKSTPHSMCADAGAWAVAEQLLEES